MLGETFRKASADTVKLFANLGTIYEPTTDAYDPLTGNQIKTSNTYPLEYVTVTDSTNQDTTLKASSFRESVVWFTLENTLIPNETWYIEGLNHEIYDIITLEKVKVNDVIVGYYALLKVRV